MGQITIYLDDATEERVRAQAKAEGKSVSAFVGEAVAAKATNGWPQWWLDLPPDPDFPTAEEIRANDLPDRGPPNLDEP